MPGGPPVPREPTVTFLLLLVAVVVVFAIAAVAAGRGDAMVEAVPDRPELTLPEGRLLTRGDLDTLRFSVGFRGYRMDEVDEVLDRVAAELEERDRRLAECTERIQELGSQLAAGPVAADDASDHG